MYSRQVMIFAYENEINNIRSFWEIIDIANPDQYMIILHNKKCVPHYHIYLKFNQEKNIDSLANLLGIKTKDMIIGGNYNIVDAAKYMLQLERNSEYRYSILDLRTNADLRSLAKILCI